MILITQSKKTLSIINIAKKTKAIQIAFILGLFLPFVLIFGIKSGMILSGPKMSSNNGNDVYTAIAKVITPNGTGTAFLISNKKLITCKHVVENSEEGSIIQLLFTKHNNITLNAKVLFLSNKYDYAILELIDEIDNSYGKLELGSSSNIELNQEIAAVGFPQGIFASSVGTVSNTDFNGDNDMLQLWIGAWYGSSGSPIFDRQTSEVLGILTSGNDQTKMIGALKIDVIKNDLELAKKKIDLIN